jgi:hypothetical protein
MLKKSKERPDLFLLLSLVLLIMIHPALSHPGLRRLALTALMFVPVVLTAVRLAGKHAWMWPATSLTAVLTILFSAGELWFNTALAAAKWGLLAVFFALAVAGLFSFIKDARAVHNEHLIIAINVYLLLGMLWFALYNAIDAVSPDAILNKGLTQAERQSELLYFSLVTLSTIGYGDVVPVQSEVRMLAALEGITGVLYVAITVALLVGAYKQRGNEE